MEQKLKQNDFAMCMDELDPAREWSKTTISQDQDIKTKSASTLLPTIPSENDFACNAPGSCFTPFLVLARPTDNDVLRSKVEALAGGRVDQEQRICFELAIVREMMSALVDELSTPILQRKIQKLLIKSRTPQPTVWEAAIFGESFLQADGSQHLLPGRHELCEYALEEVLARMKISGTSAASVWNVIARFACDDETISSLTAVDELLALPPGSTLMRILA